MNLNKLKGKRVELGITQQEMANRLGISSVSYSKKETGKTSFTFEEVIAICKELHVNPNYLVN